MICLGFAEVAAAIASGAAVAQGQSPVKIALKNWIERKRMAIVLEEDEPKNYESNKPPPGSDDMDQMDGAADFDLGNPTYEVAIPQQSKSQESGPSTPKRAALSLQSGLFNAVPNLTASQTHSVSMRSPNTSAMTLVMHSYGNMLGQMAKGMLEGAAPQLVSIIETMQV